MRRYPHQPNGLSFNDSIQILSRSQVQPQSRTAKLRSLVSRLPLQGSADRGLVPHLRTLAHHAVRDVCSTDHRLRSRHLQARRRRRSARRSRRGVPSRPDIQPSVRRAQAKTYSTRRAMYRARRSRIIGRVQGKSAADDTWRPAALVSLSIETLEADPLVAPAFTKSTHVGERVAKNVPIVSNRVH